MLICIIFSEIDFVNTDTQMDLVEPVKKLSRKKRLEVPVIVKKNKLLPEPNEVEIIPAVCLNDTPKTEKLETKTDTEVEHSSTPYTTTWSYNSELMGGEHRGFGYGHVFDSEKKSKPVKSGMIQFIKADTLMPTNEPVEQQEMKLVEENTKNLKNGKSRNLLRTNT